MNRPILILTLAAIAACGSKSDPVDTSAPTTTTPTDPIDTSVTTAYTWYQDVRPIVYDKCAMCHNADGIGTGDFTTYDGAYAARAAIEAWLAGGLMPLATADPTCQPYHGADRMHLEDDLRDVLIDWAAGGAPEGDEASAVEVELYDGHLSDANVDMPMPFAHTLEGPAGSNDYFCTVPDNPFDFEYIEAIDVELGDPKVVHHMCLFADLGGDAGAGYGVDPVVAKEEGFSCGNPIIENDWVPLHCWAPGMEPVEFPEGIGMATYPEPFLQLVIQMHYFNEDGATHTDQSSYKFRTVPSIEREVWMDVMGPERLDIPAGAEAHVEEQTIRNWYNTDVDILGAFPHMHLLGAAYEAKLDQPDGGEECLVRGEYDFDHQATYMFEEPVEWGADEDLSFSCTFNNSESNPDNPASPPQDVSFGEGTDDEMCYLLFYVAEK